MQNFIHLSPFVGVAKTMFWCLGSKYTFPFLLYLPENQSLEHIDVMVLLISLRVRLDPH